MNKQTKKILHYALFIGIPIILVVVIVVIIVVVVKNKSKSSSSDPIKPDDDDVEIVDSYDNTAELMEKFPVENPTRIIGELEERIQNRLLTGFENWNRGYKAWKKWGNILYTNESIYNVHGARLSLAQYQKAMDITLKQTNILMGSFHNMLICGDFAAIYYDIVTIIVETQVPGTVMEFVLFKEYGENLGTRVVEGWGGSKDQSYENMCKFQDEKQREIQEKQNEFNRNYKIPDEKSLKDKYIVKYNTELAYNDSNADEMINVILEGFDHWNQGINQYIEWIDVAYSTDALSYGLKGEERNMTQYKEAMTELCTKEKIEKLYFDNILIRDDWAAIHYRYRITNLETESIDVGDRMQFLKFEIQEGGLKIVSSWIK